MNIRSLIGKVRHKETAESFMWRYAGEDVDEYGGSIYFFELLYNDRLIYAVSVTTEEDEDKFMKHLDKIEKHFKKEFKL